MATKSRTARSVPLGRGAHRTRRGPGVATGGGCGAAQECRVHFLSADTIILHLRARPPPAPLPSKRRWRPCTRRTPGAQARLGQGTGAAYRLVRELVPFIEADIVLYPYMEAVYRVVAEGSLVAAVNSAMHEVDTQENIL